LTFQWDGVARVVKSGLPKWLGDMPNKVELLFRRFPILELQHPMAKLQLTVSDMACSACADTITKAVQSLDNQATINADLDTKQVEIASSAPDEQVKKAIADAGYSIQ